MDAIAPGITQDRVLFERRARMTRQQLLQLVSALSPLAFFVTFALRHRAPLAVLLVLLWFAIVITTLLQMKRLITVRVSTDWIAQRRFHRRLLLRRSEVTRIARVSVCYPGASKTLVPMAILMGDAGRAVGAINLFRWTPQEIGGLVDALGVGAADYSATIRTPRDVNAEWPGSLSPGSQYFGYWAQGFAYVMIGLIGVASWWLVNSIG